MIPGGAYGGTSEVTPILKIVMPLLKSKLQSNQMRLLLKGEEGLANRIRKCQYNDDKVKQIMLEAAMKYQLILKDGERTTKLREPSKPVVAETSDPEWKIASSKRKTKQVEQTSSNHSRAVLRQRAVRGGAIPQPDGSLTVQSGQSQCFNDFS